MGDTHGTYSDNKLPWELPELRSQPAFTSSLGAGWNIVAVANPATRNPSYTWNIIDGQTYPFLSWQSVS
jgi:hypothetical protein